MGKAISLIVLAILCFIGIKTTFSSFRNPEFTEMTINELDSLGLRGATHLHIIDGISTGEYMYKATESAGSVISITYPLVNIQNLYLNGDTSHFRTKVIVYDSHIDRKCLETESCLEPGIKEVKGKVVTQDRAGKDERKMLGESFFIEEDYIVIESGWTKPSLLWGLLLTFIPGILLFFNFRNFFGTETEEKIIARYDKENISSQN